MDYRGQSRYISQYDDVGDLDFDMVFTPGHDQNHHNQPHQPRHHHGRNGNVHNAEEENKDEPMARHTELGRRWRIHLIEELEREGRDPGDLLNMPTWHCQIQEDLWRGRRRERGQAVWDLTGSVRPAGIDQVGGGGDGPDQRGSDNDDEEEELIFDFDLDEDAEADVGYDYDDREWERERRPRRHVRGQHRRRPDDGEGEGEADGEREGGGEAAQRRSLSPTARHELEADLARTRDVYLQMQFAAPPAALQDMRDEIEYLEAVLSGRFAQWTRRPQNEDGEEEAEEHGEGRRRKEDDPGCYYDVPLSAQDPRLPPAGEARSSPVELHDSEGPRYLGLITLDNPDAEARRREREVREEAARAFARYEAQWFTVVERAIEGRALRVLSGGPRGVVWVVEAGRVDVVGALLRSREEPFNLTSWEVLGVGVGAADGSVFMLHTGVGKLGGRGSKQAGR